MALTATELTTIGIMSGGGSSLVPIDSGSGRIVRPTLRGSEGAAVATLERFFDYFIDIVPDPDTAMAQDPFFDERLRQQPDVHAALLIREQTVAQHDWSVDASLDPTCEPELAKRVARYTDAVLRQMDTVALYEEMQQAISLGGVGHEFIWERDETGIERPVRFQHLHKSNFVFDRLGNMALLTRGHPMWGAYVSPNPDNSPGPVEFSDGRSAVYFPQGKFVYHRYNAVGGPWTRPAEAGYVYWGRGEDTRLYILVTAAQFALRFWLKFLERWGFPPTDFYFPDNARPDAEIQAIVDDVRNGAIAAMPRTVGAGNEYSMYKVETREVPSMSAEFFNTFLNEYIAPKVRMIILGSADEQAKPQDGGGGYSDHVSRKESGSGVVFRRDGLRISETLNRQLVPHIVLRMWPGIPAKYYPKHKLQAEEERDRKQEMEIATATAALVPIKESEVYERSGFTKPNPDDKTVFNGGGVGMDDPLAAAMGGQPPNTPPGGGSSGSGGPVTQGGTPDGAIGQGGDAGGGSVAQGEGQPADLA